ncbi:MAG: O-antigen ligase family protein [Thermodesulfobacteriota bacterium]
MKKPFAIIIEAALAALILFTPFAFGAAPLWAYTFMELTVLFIVTVWVIKMISEGELKFPRTPLNLFILLFLILVIFQIVPLPEFLLNIISPATGQFYDDTYKAIAAGLPSGSIAPRLASTVSLNPYATKAEFIKFLAYLGTFFIVIANFNSRARLRRLLIVIVATGFLLALFALIQYFTWNGRVYWFYDYIKGGSPFGPFINKNNFAGYINLIIPLALAMTFYEKDKAVKILFAFMALVMTGALFLSMSRGGSLAFLGSMAFMGFLLFFTRQGQGRRLAFVIPGIFLVVVFFFLASVGIDPVVERLSTLTSSATYTRQVRWTVWASTIQIIKDYPVLGTGLETFETVFPAYRSPQVWNLHWRDAHNDYLQLLAETGFIGFLIALSNFVIFFRLAFRKVFAREGKGGQLTAWLLGSVVAFLLTIVVTSNSHIPATVLLFSVICAIVVRLAMNDVSVRDSERIVERS